MGLLHRGHILFFTFYSPLSFCITDVSVIFCLPIYNTSTREGLFLLLLAKCQHLFSSYIIRLCLGLFFVALLYWLVVTPVLPPLRGGTAGLSFMRCVSFRLWAIAQRSTLRRFNYILFIFNLIIYSLGGLGNYFYILIFRNLCLLFYVYSSSFCKLYIEKLFKNFYPSYPKLISYSFSIYTALL